MLDAIDVPHYWDPRPVHEDGTREKLQELGDQSAHKQTSRSERQGAVSARPPALAR